MHPKFSRPVYIRLSSQVYPDLFVTIDAADEAVASRYTWYPKKQRPPYTKFYAVTIINGRRVYLHRLLMGLSCDDSRRVDHIDGDGLNNCRTNLRVCTQAQNTCNRGTQENNKSGYKGVWWDTANARWKAQIRSNGKAWALGYFDNPKEAALAYDAKAKVLHGEFARLNFPEDDVA